MKKLLLFSIAFTGLWVCFSSSVNAQGVGINSTNSSPDPSAGLDVNFTNKGALIPRMTTAQRDAISSPALGLLILNSDCQNLNLFTTIGWQPLGNSILPSPAGTITGSPTVCQSQNSVSYSVPAITAATSYTWAYSGTGSTISGSTNSITINFSASATSGNLTVRGTNACGNGTISTSYAIIVNAAPAAPTAATHIYSQTQIAWNWNTVSGATGYKWGTTNNYSSAVDNVASTSYTQTGLTCNTAYTLYVWAYNACGNSSYAALIQTTFACSACGTIALDATSQVTAASAAATSTFTINTNNANEIILVGANGGTNGPLPQSVTVDAYTVTQVAAATGDHTKVAMYGCIATATGSHTITVTWGADWYPLNCMAYAASFTGFCTLPTIAANVQSVTAVSSSTTTISKTITPATANSCLFGDYYNYTNSGTAGVVTWTNNNLIRTDHQSGNAGWDGSIANTQLSTTSAVTVTAVDNVAAAFSTSTIMILAVVHP